jgi:hypothetical protein
VVWKLSDPIEQKTGEGQLPCGPPTIDLGECIPMSSTLARVHVPHVGVRGPMEAHPGCMEPKLTGLGCSSGQDTATWTGLGQGAVAPPPWASHSCYEDLGGCPGLGWSSLQEWSPVGTSRSGKHGGGAGQQGGADRGRAGRFEARGLTLK